MEQQSTSVQKTGTHIGIFTGLAAVVYHILLIVTGLAQHTSLHFLTGIILVVGVCIAIKQHKAKRNGRINYLDGIGVGFIVGLVASVIFTITQIIGDYVFNMAYSYSYITDDLYGQEPAIWIVGITWILIGVVMGALIGYIAMQFFKNPDHKLSS